MGRPSGSDADLELGATGRRAIRSGTDPDPLGKEFFCERSSPATEVKVLTPNRSWDCLSTVALDLLSVVLYFT